MTKWECSLNIGVIDKCRTKGLDVVIVLSELTNHSVLTTNAEFKNTGDLLCSSLDKFEMWDSAATVELLGPSDWQPGQREDWGFRIAFVNLEAGEVLPSEKVSILWDQEKECDK